MCVVRVSMQRGRRSAEQIRRLSQAINDALVEGYEMDPRDTFQIFEEVEPAYLVYNRDYRTDEPRSDDFLLFSIVGGPKPPEVKKRFYESLTRILGVQAAVRPQDVFVGMQDAPAACWSFANGDSL